MSHASKSHDAIDRLIEIRENLDRIIAEEEKRQALLAKEQAALEMRIAIANAQRLLSKIARQSRISDGDREQINGVKDQLSRVA